MSFNVSVLKGEFLFKFVLIVPHRFVIELYNCVNFMINEILFLFIHFVKKIHIY